MGTPERLILSEEEFYLESWQSLFRSGFLSLEDVEIRDVSPLTDSLRDLSIEDEFSDEDNEFPGNEEEDTSGLRLRDYQKELAETALTGRNCIICAPTGSGKTRVAVKIILEHLQRVPDAKIAFFARTGPLVRQQYQVIKKHLPSNFEILEMTGGKKDSMHLHMYLPSYSVLVLTPGVLVNHLCGDKPLLSEGISAFTLLVFDECHHAHKDDSYNHVARYYLKEKRRQGNLPQIVGLTATIGVEKAKDCETAIKNIMKVCGNLDVDHLKVVKRNIVELIATVPKPPEVLEELQENTSNEVKMKILEIMKLLEEIAAAYASDLMDPDVLCCVKKAPLSKKNLEYCHWVINLRKAVKEVKIEDASSGNFAFRYIDVITDYLQAYHFALESIELAQIEDVINFLDHSFLPFQQNPDRTTQEIRFYQEFLDLKQVASRQRMNFNPNLEKLAQKLREHVIQKGPDSCAIIFVRTRILAEALVSWLERCGEDDLMRLKARKFTGLRKSEGQGVMTVAEQDNVVAKFRSGEVRVLVATSVAEEGLDIRQCNVVIRYNYSRNEISKVQTRGRTRSDNGISILLAMPNVIRQERINCERVKLMEASLAKITEMSSAQMSQNVQAYQGELFKEWDLKALAEEEKRRKMENVNFRVICCGCRKVCIPSSDLRTILEKHRVSINQDLLSYIKLVPTKEKEFDEISFVGTALCQAETEPGKRCNFRIGKMIKYKHNPILALGCDKIIFLRDNEQRPDPPIKKWGDVPYYIKEITLDDIIEYSYGIRQERGEGAAAN